MTKRDNLQDENALKFRERKKEKPNLASTQLGAAAAL